uniref:Armadillo repeat-containing protein 8 n=1 Tax=Amphora coffeiformis TaxID=265554 RepID=A0A7S3LEH1_9STRA
MGPPRRPPSVDRHSPRDAAPPPTQVFTRGRHGVVKTRTQTNRNRRAASMDPSRRNQQRSNRSRAPRSQSTSKRTTMSHVSVENMSYAMSSDISEGDYSNYSAPALTPKKEDSSYSYSERREPSSSRTSPSVIKQQQLNKRDLSPERSIDMQKQHSRTTRKVVDEMCRANVASRRIASVTNACSLFDHHDEARHNIEVSFGAAHVLGKMIQQPVSDDEMRIMCAALEMVFRASPGSVRGAYQRLNSSLLPALFRMLDRCEERSVKHADISILNITKIVYYLSKCPDLRIQLCRQQGMLDFLFRVATRVLNPECRSYRLLVAMNLASEERNKVTIYEKEGLVSGILRIAHMDTSDLARQNAALVIQELATCDLLHVPLAKNDQLLGTLVKMALVEKSLQTRESVINSLQTLAFTKKNRLRLCTFKDGVVLEALRKTLSVDSDDKVRRRAAGTLTNLACEETAEVMGKHPGLLETLAIVATKDYNADVQARSALALTKIGSNIKAGMDCFKPLLDALVAASLGKSSSSVIAVLRVKAREPGNRHAMAHHEGVLDTLVDVCVSKISAESDRDNAMRTLMHLLNDEKNRAYMCTKNVLKALVRGANYEEEVLSEARESAIIAMERMATEQANRAFMARYPALLESVAKAVEREFKLEDEKVESEHGYLAKPLLMSLLLAM